MKKTLLTAALVATSALSANAATVVNGSFESTPSGMNGSSSWEIFDSIEGWTESTGNGIEIHTDPTLSVIDAQDGDNYLELHSNGLATIQQTVTLGVGLHDLSFFYSSRSNTPGENDMSFAVEGLVSGTVLNAPNFDFPVGEWTEVGAQFNVLTAGDYVLSFSALNGGNNRVGALLDNISINVAAVPVPAAGLMLLTALGGAAAMRRKKG